MPRPRSLLFSTVPTSRAVALPALLLAGAGLLATGSAAAAAVPAAPAAPALAGWPGPTGQPASPGGKALLLTGESPALPAFRPPATRPAPAVPARLSGVDGPALGLDAPWPGQVLSSLRLSSAVPGDVALVLALDAEAGTLSIADLAGQQPLTELARRALQLSPAWVRHALARNLGELQPAEQDRYAALIVEAPDPRYIDELAFGIAHVAPEDLAGEAMTPELLLHNVEGIYRLDPLLEYVRLVEVGTPGTDDDFYTTTAYLAVEDGVEQEWQLARDDYYWWVVHPRLQDELPGWIDPGTGYPYDPPRGVFWRDYLWEGDAQSIDYREHYLLGLPRPIGEADLDGLGPTAYGTFPPGGYPFPLNIVRDSVSEQPVLIEFAWGTGRVVATTIPVELHPELPLLANLLTYGNGNISLSRDDRLLLLSSRPADAPELEPITGILERGRYSFDVIAPDQLRGAELSAYRKLLVPTGEPRSVHEALAATREAVEEWVARGGVLEVHAFDPADPWCGLTLPGGFTCAAGEVDDVYVEGWPSLRQMLEGVRYLWDGRKGNLDGDRWPAPGDTAVDRVGSFVGQNLLDNVAEMAAKSGLARQVEPVAIIRGHYGNCGELQDLLTAAGRTALIPVINVSNPHEDHVWNEFRYRDRWVSYQDSWSDSGTILDDRGV
ncbi:MAG: hypothetical protein FJ125_05870, partial [Deltaproteobacteria bacterium]|nr:hypothetical protein [Deltaproteobacteria bacterium]